MEKLNRMTFWQVLIAGLVLVIIAMLLLPAIQASRESAQITLCRENLRRIGLAMHSYVEAYNGFPLGITSVNLDIGDIENESIFHATSTQCDFPKRTRTSAWTMLLPYLEEYETHSAYNMRLACCAPANLTAATQVVGILICPLSPRRRTAAHGYYQKPVGAVDYGLSIGNNALLTPWQGRGIVMGSREFYPSQYRPGIGAFSVNEMTKQNSFRDGMVNTFLVW